MIKKFLIGLLIFNFILASGNAMNPVLTPEQTRIRSFKIGGETVYQIIAPNESLIKLQGYELGLMQQLAWVMIPQMHQALQWIQHPYGAIENQDLIDYFRHNAEEESYISATCGFGAAFIAYTLTNLLNGNPKISRDEIYRAFYPEVDDPFNWGRWPFPELDQENNVYKFNSDKFKEFFKNAIPVVVGYRRDKNQVNVYEKNLSSDEISHIVSTYQPAISDVKDKIVLIETDYDPNIESKKDTLQKKINAVIKDSSGSKFVIFICGNNFQTGAHWVAIIIRKNSNNNVEILYSDTANWKVDQLKEPIFHVISLIKKLQGSETFEAWMEKLKRNIDAYIFNEDSMKGIDKINKLYEDYKQGNAAAKSLEDWFKENLENLISNNQPSKDFRNALYEHFLKPRCKNCGNVTAKPIPLPCGMVFGEDQRLTRKKNFDHYLVCQDCLNNKLFDDKGKSESTIYSWKCPECGGYVTHKFKRLIESEGYSGNVILACAMYYGQDDKEQSQFSDTFLEKFISSDARSGISVYRAKTYLERIKQAQKDIRPKLALCNLEEVLKKPLLGQRLEELRGLLDLPDLGDKWFAQQLSDLLLQEEPSQLGGKNAETLTLRLLELNADPNKIIDRLCDLSDKIAKFELYEFIKNNQAKLLKNRTSKLVEVLDGEKIETLAKVSASNKKEKIRELNEQKQSWLNELAKNDSAIQSILGQIHNNHKLRGKVEELGKIPAGLDEDGKYTESQITEIIKWSNQRWENATKEQLRKILVDAIELFRLSNNENIQIRNSLDILIKKFCEHDKSKEYSDEDLATLKDLSITGEDFERSLPIDIPRERQELLKTKFENAQHASPLKKNLQLLATQLETLKEKLKKLQAKLVLLNNKLHQ